MQGKEKSLSKDEGHSPPGFYDGEDRDPAPWLQPGPTTPDPDEVRGPTVGQALSDWQAAQAALALEMAAAAAAMAGLEMRVRHGREGWRRRLVYRAVADLSWQLTTRVPADRLALYRQGVLSAAGDEGRARDLRMLNWAARRWLRPVSPFPVAAFLGEPAEPVSLDGRFSERRVAGQGLLATERVMEAVDFSGFEQAVEGAALYPFLRGAYALAAWQRLDLGYERAGVQGVVLASVIGSGEKWSGFGFLPVSLGGSPPGNGGSIAARCRAWLAAVERGALAALLEIDRLEGWRKRASGLDRGGRGLPLVVDALESEPVVSVRGIADGTGLSRASVQNILSELIAAGLAREVTGNARYRVFEAVVG